ncbi:MAG TPA: hypothetical protein VM198_07645 [Longimicrobiales bacterium]|nr:hypothetical protein [Longimicrobiales bacterium]
MSARFRIRTKEGQELSFASREIFAEFVRSGDLSPDDVVYDAETREWSSARTHPVVLQIELEADARESSAEPPAPKEPDAGGSSDDQASTGTLDFELAPPPTGLTPEQESAAFVAKMEAERASELDFDEAPMQGFKRDKGASSVVGDLAPPPPRELRPEPAAEREEPHRKRRDPPVEHPPTSRYASATAVPAQPKRKRSRGAGGRYAPFLILGLAAVVAGVYFGPQLLAPGAGPEPEGVVEPPTPPPSIPATDEALRARARERFLTATQAALRGLDPVPDVWLRGSYLAEPSVYPEVRDVWEGYLTIIRDVRAADNERYRQAYLRALDDARVEGAARTLRMSSATAAFQAAAAPRQAHYDRAERLATAALQGHDALVAAEGTIAYQPARGPALSEDPVIEAVGRSPEAQTLLNQVLDLILTELHGERGPQESGNVREWVWDGLLDAMTN